MDEMNDMLCLKLSLLSYISLHLFVRFTRPVCFILSCSVLLRFSPPPGSAFTPNLVAEVVCRVGFPTHPCLSVVLLRDCCLDVHSHLVARRVCLRSECLIPRCVCLSPFGRVTDLGSWPLGR